MPHGPGRSLFTLIRLFRGVLARYGAARVHRAPLEATALACALLVGCADEVIVWRDPDVRIADATIGHHGPRALVVGLGEGEAFVPLADDPTLAIVHGLQGGTWTMPTLRAETLASSLAVSCTLMSGDEALGRTEVTTPTRPAAPGWVEVARLPIPVTHAPPDTHLPIADLDGAAATLRCAVSAAGASAASDDDVVLEVE